MFRLKRAASWLLATALITVSGVGMAQDTTATIEAVGEAQTTASLAPLAVMTPESGSTESEDDTLTQTVVLIGEKVSVADENSAKGPFPDFEALTTSTIGGRVVDLTTHGLSMAETAEMVGKAVIQNPDIVIFLTGFTDEKNDTPDDQQRAAMKQTIAGLEKTGARVFLVPAATTVGAMTSANLRLVASELGITFIPIGTEVAGQPFEDAFTGVRNELASPATEAPQPEAAEPSKAVTIQGGRIADPAADAAANVDYETKKASIERELDRIAGQAGDSPILPEAGITTTSLFADMAAEDAATTIPEGGVLTKRGREAQESINMRPLPAVKAFRPSIPVPRNEIDVKEPELSR